MKTDVLKQPLPLITLLSFLGGIFLSFSLWFSISPVIPRIPLFSELASWSTFLIIDSLSFVLFFILLLTFILKKSMRSFIGFAFLLSMTWLCILDINRINVLSYFYLNILFIIWLSSIKRINMDIGILIFISVVYCWAGLNKFNPHFYTECYTWFMNIIPFTAKFVDSKLICYAIPFTEATAGLGLLFNKTRKASVVFLILMHIYIISIMLISKWSTVILPWNVYLILTLMHFYNKKFNLINAITQLDDNLKCYFLLVGVILPVAYLLNIGDSTFAFTMYSGRNQYAEMYFTENDLKKLDKKYHDFLISNGKYKVLDLDELGRNFYNCPLNNSNMQFTRMYKNLLSNPEDSSFLVINSCLLLSTKKQNEVVY